MNFEKLKLVKVPTTDDDVGHMYSIQEDFGQEDDPELAVAGVWNPSTKGEAYAKLFAAAPELLEALQQVVQQYENVRAAEGYPSAQSESTKRAKEIIAKALGE